MDDADALARIGPRLPDDDRWWNHGFTVHLHHWDRVRRVSDVADAAVDACADGVARADLVGWAEPVVADPDEVDAIVGLFVACQMWGTGTGDNRGAWRTDEALSADDATEVLASAVRMVLDGEGHRLYMNPSRRWLPRWHNSFVTKFAYAVSLGVDADRPDHFVLDELVLDSLNQLGWDRPRRYADRYADYNSMVLRWGDALGVRPDQVEWVLWTAAGDL